MALAAKGTKTRRLVALCLTSRADPVIGSTLCNSSGLVKKFPVFVLSFVTLYRRAYLEYTQQTFVWFLLGLERGHFDFSVAMSTRQFQMRQIGAFRPLRKYCARLKDRRISWKNKFSVDSSSLYS